MRPTLLSAKMPWLEFNAWQVGRSERRYPLFWRQPRRDSVRVSVFPPDGLRLVAGPESDEVRAAVATVEVQSREASGGSTSCRMLYNRPAVGGTREGYFELKKCLEKRAALGQAYWVWERR